MVGVNDTYYTLTPQNYTSDEWYLGDTIQINIPENITTDTKMNSKIVHTGASLVIFDTRMYGTSGTYVPDTGNGNGDNGETNIIDEGYGRITLNNDGSNGYITDDSFFEFKILTGNQYVDIDNVRHTFSNKDVVKFVVNGDQEEGDIYISNKYTPNPQIQTFDLEIDLFVNDVKEKSGTITDINLWKVEYLDVDITYIVPSNGEWTDLKNNSISIDGYPSDPLEDNISIYITDINKHNSFLLNMDITNNWIDVNPASYKVTSNN